MADFNSINNTEKAEISGISNELQILATHLAGVQPILKMIVDSSSVGTDVGNSLELIGGLSAHVTESVFEISYQLTKIGESDERKSAIEEIRQQVASSAQH